MTNSQKLELRASEIRQRLNEIAGMDDLTDEIRGESDKLTEEYASVETKRRAALVAESDAGDVETHQTVDAEDRERVRLRGRASFGAFLLAAMQGREPAGALAEYSAACGVSDGIPLDLFESDRPEVETHADAVSPAPSTTGRTLHPIQPYVFADSIAAPLGISMPSVGSGSHSWARISTALTAGAKAKGAAQESTAAALTAVTASPRRISARLSIEAEDVASIGVGGFESALRSNLTGALSDAYDSQCIAGDGSAPNVDGLIHQLTRPTNPTAVADFDGFLSTFVDQIDGTWARTIRDVRMVANVDAYMLSAKTFRDKVIDTGQRGAASLGSVTAADYLGQHTAGWSGAARMPETPSSGANDKIAVAIVRRTGRSLLAAVHPTWGSLSIDDIYSDSASARRHISMHVLVGDKVLIVQPDAYKLALFKVSA